MEGAITVNIGDMLMQWSDDRLKSTFHRVRMPRPGEYQGPRYSIGFFNQANKSSVIQGPKKKYAPISGLDFILAAMQRARGTETGAGGSINEACLCLVLGLCWMDVPASNPHRFRCSCRLAGTYPVMLGLHHVLSCCS